MQRGPLSRWLPPVAAALILGAAAVTLSHAQPVPSQSPGPPPQDAPTSIEDALEPSSAPAEEAPPPVSGAADSAPAPLPKTVVDAADEKETPAATTPLPEKAPAPPKRVRRAEAIIQTLDKVTAETVRFSAPVGKPVRWKDLVFTVKACEEAADDDTERGVFANLEIYSEPRVGPGRTPPPAKQVYRGWMFAEAPAVHAFEHPVYDVWLIACRTA